MAAVIAPTRIIKESRFAVWEWAGLANGDSGSPIDLASFSDITFKIYGTLGSGGEVTMLGSLNEPGGTDDAGSALEEEAGVAMVLTAASPWGTSRNAPWSAWPYVTNGDGTTAITIRAIIRR